MRGSEPKVNFFLESTRDIAVSSRATVNDWYTRFPDADGSFREKLRSTDDLNHQTALDELFVHERLMGAAEVRYEENGQGPDFRLYRDGEYVAGVEVLSLFMRGEWAGELAQHDRIADALNERITTDRWFLHFEIVRMEQQPSIKRLASWVRKTMDALPPHDPASPPPFVPPYAVYEAPGVTINFEFFPRRAKPGAEGDRIVGMGPPIGGWVNSGERLRVALNGKAGGRYDLRTKPFALVVAVHDSFCSLDQVMDALYGSEQLVIATHELTRAPNGFFGRSTSANQGKNRRVSCVFVIQGWLPWAPEEATIYRLDNPFADRPFPGDLLQADYRFTEVSRDNRVFAFDWRPPLQREPDTIAAEDVPPQSGEPAADLPGEAEVAAG